jgi:LPXTG-site transpeptidase (sortase) family protein
MNMRWPLMRLAQRVLLGMGIVILVCAGGSIAYAEIYQRYESAKFIKHDIVAERSAPDLTEGDIVGKLEIPRIGISVMVLQGVEEETLYLGTGHVPGTPLPGIEGNVAIAAHRDTFFRKLEGILPGDRIQFATKRGTYEYVVESTQIVDPRETQSMESRARGELTHR